MAINITFNLFMNNMNKLYKCTLGLLTAFILSFACFSGADDLGINLWREKTNGWTTTRDYSSFDKICVLTYNTNNSVSEFSVGGGNRQNTCNWNLNQFDFDIDNSCCSNGGNLTLYSKNSLTDFYVLGINLINENSCPLMSSIECQTEYNLIPISEVTANYCALNFGMIDPQECPINSGTGAIVRSNLMINDVPYAQNQNINVFIPDFLAWNISFNDLYTVIDVEGYNADESYIENVINNEKLTPTNEDFEEMITGFMINYFPYLALAIVFLYLARKIFKLFK